MSSHFRVVVNGETYCQGTREECQKNVDLHKNTLSGHRKPTKASTLNYTIEEVAGDYPTNAPLAPLNYKPGPVPGSFR